MVAFSGAFIKTVDKQSTMADGPTRTYATQITVRVRISPLHAINGSINQQRKALIPVLGPENTNGAHWLTAVFAIYIMSTGNRFSCGSKGNPFILPL